MYKLFFILLTSAVFSCSGNKTTETSAPTSDTLMDTTTIKMNADTTVKRLDHLEDSIKKLRDKAADKADEKY
jgi:hypothetical protein